MARHTIKGQVKDVQGAPIADAFVEAFDSDFGSTDDYLGSSFSDAQGSFEIAFEDQAYKGAYEVLERNPDVYLVISDQYGVVMKTDVRSNASDDDLDFGEIVMEDSRPYDDPYFNSAQRMVALFAAAGDSVDLAQVNIARSSRQMVRSITSWLHYTDPRTHKLYGYPGPQVIARPKEVPGHDHTIPWRRPAK